MRFAAAGMVLALTGCNQSAPDPNDRNIDPEPIRTFVVPVTSEEVATDKNLLMNCYLKARSALHYSPAFGIADGTQRTSTDGPGGVRMAQFHYTYRDPYANRSRGDVACTLTGDAEMRIVVTR